VELHSLAQLLGYAFAGFTVAGIEGRVIAVGTATKARSPLAMWAAKACIYSQLLYPPPKELADVLRIGVVPLLIAPRVTVSYIVGFQIDSFVGHAPSSRSKVC